MPKGRSYGATTKLGKDRRVAFLPVAKGPARSSKPKPKPKRKDKRRA